MKLKQIAFVVLLCTVCAIPIALVGRQARTSIANGTSLPTTCAVGDLFYLTTSNGTGALNACFSPSVWAPANVLGTTTFYVCAKGAGGTCVYNGDAGTVATPSDAGPCLTKAAPCATLAGVRALMANAILTGIVTIQLATTAGTGTDCYQPNGVIFDMPTQGGGFPYFPVTISSATDVYPSVYIYIQGDTTTPSNVKMRGGANCAATTSSLGNAIFFKHNAGRVRGVEIDYYKFGQISCTDSASCWIESYTVTSDNPGNNLGYAAEAYYGSHLAIGGTWSVTNMGFLNLVAGSTARMHTPLGYPTATISVSGTGNVTEVQEQSHLMIDGGTFTFSGAGAYNAFAAQDNGNISFNADATTALTMNASNATELWAQNNGRIDEACSTTFVTCTFTALAKRAVAQYDSRIVYTGTSSADGASTGSSNACVAQSTFPNYTAFPGSSGCAQQSPMFTSAGGGMSVANVGANSCGTTAATIAGNNNSGVVTVGATSGTQCRVRFNTAAATAWDCTVTDSTTTIATRATPVDTQHTDLLGAFVAGDKLTYVCFAR